MDRFTHVLAICTVLLCITALSWAQPVSNSGQIPAFPGAEGAAKFTPGGRGGDVYVVTHTGSSGPGSLAHGIETAEGARTIVFNTGGTIHFSGPLDIRNKSNLTIAGQTAPGDGITLRFDDGGLRIQDSRDVVITHLRVANASSENLYDLLRTNGSENVLLSHLSLRWGTRGNFVSRPDGPVTTQFVINAEPTDRKLAGWYGHMRTAEGIYNQTIRKNLGIHQGGRLNMVQNGRFEFINNVTFNGYSRRPQLGPFYVMARPWHGTAASNIGPQIPDLNVIGNVFIDGDRPPALTFGFGRGSRVYLRDNVRDFQLHSPFSPEQADDDYQAGPGPQPADEFARVDLPLDLRLKESQRTRPVSHRRAYIEVLSRSGASASRDVHDHRYVRDVMNKRPRPLPATVDEVYGDPFPDLDPGTPLQITASDGIPDVWKLQRGLDPETSYHLRYNSEGYTWLEVYLHDRMRGSIPPEEQDLERMYLLLAEGSHATAGTSAAGSGRDTSRGGIFEVGRGERGTEMGLLRLDVSSVEPGMVADAVLELDVLEGGESGAIRVYGLDHDRPGQRWPAGRLEAGRAPGIERSGETLRVKEDEVVFLGELRREGRVMVLDNPNLAVFLNLAMYYREDPDADTVTLILDPPAEEGTTRFFTGGTSGQNVEPRLVLQAVRR